MLRTAQWTLDVHDLPRLAQFWSEALGLEVEMGDDEGATLWSPNDRAVTVWLQATEAPKQQKNRCHPDLVVEPGPADDDEAVDREVERLLALGAHRADVGQTGREDFVVLADPEGNEFCVLRHDPRDRTH